MASSGASNALYPVPGGMRNAQATKRINLGAAVASTGQASVGPLSLAGAAADGGVGSNASALAYGGITGLRYGGPVAPMNSRAPNAAARPNPGVQATATRAPGGGVFGGGSLIAAPFGGSKAQVRQR